MAHWKSFIAVALILASLLAGCGGDAVDRPVPTATHTAGPGGFNVLQPLATGREVTAPDGRYTLRVPGEWVQYDDQLAELAFRTVGADLSLSMNIVREDIGENMRVQAYAERARTQIGSTYRNVLSHSLTPVQVGTVDAYRWIYTAGIGQQEWLFYQLYLVEGDQGFVVTGLAPVSSDMTIVRETFDAISGSMNFARG